MKSLITTILAMISLAGYAQMALTPSKKSFEKKWIRDEKYQMTWYAMKDTSKFEIGLVFTEISRFDKNLHVTTSVKLKSSPAAWADTTIAEIRTLKPIYHSSFNAQRDMSLKFGNIVTGFYNDKRKNLNKSVSDTTNLPYFDSNIYPVLLGWLPLKTGYTQDISIYDYNPLGKIGVLKASIKVVQSGTYKTERSGIREVWIVKVTDEIGMAADGQPTF